MPQIVKKLILFLTISLLIAYINTKNILLLLKQIFYTYYLIAFKENKLRALIYFDSKINTITKGYAFKLNLKIRFIYIKDQQIDGAIIIDIT